MKAYDIIDLLTEATSNLNNIFEMIGHLSSDSLKSCGASLMIGPATKLVRDLAHRLNDDLFTQDELNIIRGLYWHIHFRSAQDMARKEEHLDEDERAVWAETRAIAEMETSAYKLNSAAHRIYSDMVAALEKYGLSRYEP